MTARRITSIGFGCLAALLALAAVAWACTPSAYLYPISPGGGQPGSEVTVRGGQFGTGTVEIRWASDNGRLLGTALGPEFSTKVTLPDRAEGVHYIVAVARDGADPTKILARRSEAVQITADGRSSSTAASSLWGDAGQALGETGGFPATAVAGIGLGALAATMALFAAVVVRRRKAESR
ncbi:MAG: hypothetical protein ACRDIA_08320 [Actinomycetota bacterium]